MRNKLKFGLMLALGVMMAGVAAAQTQPVDERAMARAIDRVNVMTQTITLGDEAKQKLLNVNYEYYREMNELGKQKNAIGEEEYKRLRKESSSRYSKAIKEVVPADQHAALNAWWKLPTDERGGEKPPTGGWKLKK